jgi:hypothetical protein
VRWITQTGDTAAQGKPAIEVRVNATLTGLESAQLDQWVAAHLSDLHVVEVQRDYVCLHGRSPSIWAMSIASATRNPGLLTESLDEALRRLRTTGDSS